MGRFLKYVYDGMTKSFVVGVPDFSQNNQYVDMINIGNDMRYAIGGVKRCVEKDDRTKPYKRKSRRKRIR